MPELDSVPRSDAGGDGGADDGDAGVADTSSDPSADADPAPDPVPGRRRSFRADTRAIEGLPVRLVVSLVVGVACLSVMLNMLSGVGTLAVAELDARPSPDVVAAGDVDVTVTVVGPDGESVAGATVVVTGGTARLPGVVTGETGADGTVDLSLSPSLRANQETGTLTVDVKPPTEGGGYVDRRSNAEILVVAG